MFVDIRIHTNFHAAGHALITYINTQFDYFLIHIIVLIVFKECVFLFRHYYGHVVWRIDFSAENQYSDEYLLYITAV